MRFNDGLWMTRPGFTLHRGLKIHEYEIHNTQIILYVPCNPSVFHYDCFWMKEYQWCDFEWDSRYFPDPEGMLSRLKENNLHICVWINPYIAQKSPLFKEAKENGYLIKNKQGSVWQWDQWQPGKEGVSKNCDMIKPEFSDKPLFVRSRQE